MAGGVLGIADIVRDSYPAAEAAVYNHRKPRKLREAEGRHPCRNHAPRRAGVSSANSRRTMGRISHARIGPGG
jgi:hypothetical protein